MKFMGYKNLLIHFSNILLFSCMLVAAEQKTMKFLLVKKDLDRTDMIPFCKDFFNEMQQLFGVDIFVETGTYLGDTCAIAAKVFKQVHTIELSEELFRLSSQRFAQTPNVFLYKGDSGIILNQVLSKIVTGSRLIILLDGHWSGGNTAQGEDVPVLRELDSIKKSGKKNSVILIDDIRCFQKHAPGRDENYPYPELSVVIDGIREINPNYNCLVYGDVLMAFTDNDIVVPEIVQAMTVSRLNQVNNETLSKAEAIIAAASDQDFYHLSCLVKSLEDHHYNFWYALALHHRGNKTAAYEYMEKACRGFHRAYHYIELWK